MFHAILVVTRNPYLGWGGVDPIHIHSLKFNIDRKNGDLGNVLRGSGYLVSGYMLVYNPS